jgi:O-succinylbenzoate synthase
MIELTGEDQVKELENFIFNNEALEKLESIVDKFNIFSSLGIINQEIRHSNFLAWLLDPNETHNVSDYFTTSFLKLAIYNNTNENPDVNLIDIDTLDLSKIQVLREWNNIDVLLIDDEQKLVCVIENKVDSKEH